MIDRYGEGHRVAGITLGDVTTLDDVQCRRDHINLSIGRGIETRAKLHQRRVGQQIAADIDRQIQQAAGDT